MMMIVADERLTLPDDVGGVLTDAGAEGRRALMVAMSERGLAYEHGRDRTIGLRAVAILTAWQVARSVRPVEVVVRDGVRIERYPAIAVVAGHVLDDDDD